MKKAAVFLMILTLSVSSAACGNKEKDDNQADAKTEQSQKYSAKVLNKEQDKASIFGQLRKFTEQIRTQAKEKQRTREAVKDGR